MLLAGKTVIVSGIGPGLGIELATLAAAEGAAGLVVAARTPAKLDDAEAAIRARGLATPSARCRPTSATPRSAAVSSRRRSRRWAHRRVVNSAYVPGRFEPMESADLDDGARPST